MVKKCSFCREWFDTDDFKEYPEVFLKECNISGTCPTCQLDIFKPLPDEVCNWRLWQGRDGEKPSGFLCTICAVKRSDLNEPTDCPNYLDI